MIGRWMSRGCATRTSVIVNFGRLGEQDFDVSNYRQRPCACLENVIAVDSDSCFARGIDGDDGV